MAIDKLEEAAAASGKASDTKSVERSPTTLLVKNLPYTVTQAELQVRLRGLKRYCYNLMRSALSAMLLHGSLMVQHLHKGNMLIKFRHPGSKLQVRARPKQQGCGARRGTRLHFRCYVHLSPSCLLERLWS